MDTGGQCVMPTGTQLMLMWLVNSLHGFSGSGKQKSH